MDTNLFNQQQVDLYFDRLKIPYDLRYSDVAGLPADEKLDVLTQLHVQHLRRIPFENLSLHYSRERIVDVHLPRIFEKIIQNPENGRGGYCMETNHLFNALLRSIGFDACLVPSRVFDQSRGQYLALTHCLNIVHIGSDRYAVDVGFGGNVATVPLQLVTGEVHPLSGSMQARYRHEPVPPSRTKYWIYEFRHGASAEWTAQYCFLDVEILPEDLAVLNLGPSTSKTSFFTQKIVCLKFTGEKEFHHKFELKERRDKVNGVNEVNGIGARKPDLDFIDGVLILDGQLLKWRKCGVKQWEVVLEDEEQRTRALKDIFGISLLREQQQAIIGTVSALRPVVS
jgi:arylamine N-acetyltransferase